MGHAGQGVGNRTGSLVRVSTCRMARCMIMKHFELPIKVDLKAMAGVKWRARPSLKEIVVATKIAVNNNCSIYGAVPMCLYCNV